MRRFGLRQEGLFSLVGLHAIAAGLLAIVVIVLAVRVGLDWRATSSSNVDAMASRQSELRTLQIQTAPLRGLDKKVDLSRDQIDDFYAKRIPPSWSGILERLGNLQSSTKVRLTRVQYTRAIASGDLTEIRMDAGVSGDYPEIMKFINGLERSPTFFVIRAMALTGQQSGTVNLRLEVSTWLRPADASGIPVETPSNGSDAAPGVSEGAAPGTAQLIHQTPHTGEGF